jgi:hypothetical protein
VSGAKHDDLILDRMQVCIPGDGHDIEVHIGVLASSLGRPLTLPLCSTQVFSRSNSHIGLS